MFEIYSIKYPAIPSQGVHSLDVSINILARSEYPEPPVATAQSWQGYLYLSLPDGGRQKNVSDA
ncbi:MAG: hypothetical protein POG74_09725 [Acidocella sp.]|nr:hypothetical protein [Acidocella sp.]